MNECPHMLAWTEQSFPKWITGIYTPFVGISRSFIKRVEQILATVKNKTGNCSTFIRVPAKVVKRIFILTSRNTSGSWLVCIIKTLSIKKNNNIYLKVMILKFYVIFFLYVGDYFFIITHYFALYIHLLAFPLLAHLYLSTFGSACAYKRVLAQSSSCTNLSGHVFGFHFLIRMNFRHQPGSDSATHVFNFPKSSGVWSIVARESRSCTKPRHDVQGVPSTIAEYGMEKKSLRSPLPVDPIDSRFT